MNASSPVALALDTSGSIGSVAVAVAGEVLARTLLLRRTEHAAGVISGLSGVLGDAGVDRSEITHVLVGAGPGSFTGVRVAASTANGLASALGCPLGVVSSLVLAAVSSEALPPTLHFVDSRGAVVQWQNPARLSAERRVVLFDARGDRVYGAVVDIGEDGVHVVDDPAAGTVGGVLNAGHPTGSWFTGDGAIKHEALIRAAGFATLPPPAGLPLADGLVWMHAHAPDQVRWVTPGGWEPDYLRGSSAVPPGGR